MFAENSDKLVKKLVQAETVNAIQNYGKTYDNTAIAEDVLLEEVQEADKELDNLYMAFACTDFTKKEYVKLNCAKIKKAAINGIKELAQVCAVINKIELSGFDK